MQQGFGDLHSAERRALELPVTDHEQRDRDDASMS
jgi:hypothetical protein